MLLFDLRWEFFEGHRFRYILKHAVAADTQRERSRQTAQIKTVHNLDSLLVWLTGPYI
jgi:hypothetical protein